MTVLLLVEMTAEQEKEAYLVGKKIAKEKEFLLYLAPKNCVEGLDNIPKWKVEAIR